MISENKSLKVKSFWSDKQVFNPNQFGHLKGTFIVLMGHITPGT